MLHTAFAPVPRPSDKSCVARRSAAGGHCGRGDFGTRLEKKSLAEVFAGFSSEAKKKRKDVYKNICLWHFMELHNASYRLIRVLSGLIVLSFNHLHLAFKASLKAFTKPLATMEVCCVQGAAIQPDGPKVIVLQRLNHT